MEEVFELEEWNSRAAWVMKVLGSHSFWGSWEQEYIKRQNVEKKTVRSKRRLTGHNWSCSGLRSDRDPQEYWGSGALFSLGGKASLTQEWCIREATFCGLRKEWVVNNTRWGPVHVRFSYSRGDPEFQIFKYTQFPGFCGWSLVSFGVGKIRLAFLLKLPVTSLNWLTNIGSKIIGAKDARNGRNQVTLGRVNFTELLPATPKSSPQLKPLEQLCPIF